MAFVEHSTIELLVDKVKARFDDLEKHMVDAIQKISLAIMERDKHLIDVMDAIKELQAQVKDLQSNAAEKIILEENNEAESVLGSNATK